MTQDSPAPSVVAAPPPLPTWKKMGLVFWEIALVCMAVILPAIALGVEALTGLCADTFFDPLSNPFFVILVGLVPLVNLLVWLNLRKGWHLPVRLLGLLSGVGLTLSFLYTLLFLPLMPFALLAVVVFWWYLGFGLIGLMPLSPMLAFMAGWVLRKRLIGACCPGERALPGIRLGVGLAVLLFFAASAGEVMTLTGLRWAASESPELQNKGISLLRRMDRNDAILRVSQGGNSIYANVLLSWVNGGKPLDSAKARRIYYQVSGQDALQVRTLGGHLNPFRMGRRVLTEEFDWDDQQGGAIVGGILKGLSLQSSRLDGTLDGAAGIGYMEWTMVFRNEDPFRQREARAIVALPPGAVVSRLTLWVHGEERDAAFSSKGQVTEAYQKVVRARRDPVLVTTCGPDRIRVQCFPVESKGGEIKIRLGLTVPLQPMADADAVWKLHLPVFLERNFKWAADKGHDLWFESRSILKPGADVPLVCCETGKAGLWMARGTLPEMAQWNTDEALRIEGAGNGNAWCRDGLGEKPMIVRQSLVENPGDKPASVVLVVDGSVSMKAAAPRIAAALTNTFPAGVRLALILAGDRKADPPMLSLMTPDKLAGLAKAVESFEYVGGRCNVSALEQAWDALASEPGPAVLIWVHGPQVLTLNSPDGLLQRFERQPGLLSMINLQVKPGADKISEALDIMPMTGSLSPCADPARSLGMLFKAWRPDSKRVHAVRLREEREPQPADGVETSDHLARLWARHEIASLLAQGRAANRAKAGDLAARYHLVTPVSGAVVLETAQQFKEAGLEPVSGDSLPTVPEPELWILTGAAVLIGIWQWRRRMAAAA